jgi:Flp pilus assembly protein TadG
MKSDNRRFEKSELGQSLVEFALISVIIALTLAGILDLGRAYFAKIAITDAAAEGAAFAAYSPNCIYATGWTACDDPNNVTYRVQHASESALVDWNAVTVGTIVSPDGLVSGSTITVTVQYDFQLLTPFISSMVGDDWLIIAAEAAQPIQ